MPGYIASAMAVPLFKHQGFTNTDIATVTKVFGFWIALGGTFMAGWLIPRIGMMSSLIIGTVAGSASHLALALLAAHGGDGGNAFWTFALAVGVEGFAYAFASIVLITLHVDALVGGACGEPVRPADLPLRLSGQHSGWVLGLRDRAYGLRLVLHLDLAHRHPGRVAWRSL
jgi:MFS family permease